MKHDYRAGESECQTNPARNAAVIALFLVGLLVVGVVLVIRGLR